MYDGPAWELFRETGEPLAYLLYRGILPPGREETAENIEAGAHAPV